MDRVGGHDSAFRPAGKFYRETQSLTPGYPNVESGTNIDKRYQTLRPPQSTFANVSNGDEFVPSPSKPA